jgi:hypothetical protein
MIQSLQAPGRVGFSDERLSRERTRIAASVSRCAQELARRRAQIRPTGRVHGRAPRSGSLRSAGSADCGRSVRVACAHGYGDDDRRYR